MNECFLMGIVVEEVNFKFVLNGKNDAIAILKIRLLNNEIVNIVAYNEQADYCFRKLYKDDKIFIYGYLENDKCGVNVIVHYIYKITEDKKRGENIE